MVSLEMFNLNSVLVFVSFFSQCLVRYIDYGNTEILNRSDIVEIPLDLQFSSVAKKYRLWGLHIPSGQEVTQFDQASHRLKYFC